MKTLEELIKDKPPAVQEAIRKAMHTARLRPSSYQHGLQLGKLLSQVLMSPSPHTLLVQMLSETIAFIEHLHQYRINKSRQEGTAAGLAAYEESLRAGPGKKDD